MNCVFCKIITGDIPSYTVYEDDKVKVFLDINPKTNGHCLIVPKEHYQDLDDIPSDSLIYIMEIAKKTKLLIENKLKADGIKIAQNNGVLQDVKHFHMHIVPHYNTNEVIDIKEVYNLLTNVVG